MQKTETSEDAPQDRPEQSRSEDTSSAIITSSLRSRHLKTGSVLVIGAGVISIANGLSSILSNGSVDIGITVEVGKYCGILVLLLGAGGILSGIAAIVLKRISPALAGAVLGMAGGGLVGFWLGLGAIVLLTLSHEDF